MAAHLALATAFNLRVPLGGAPDEPAHAAYIQSLAGGHLPVWDWPRDPQSYEAFQPPLYYAGAALWLLPVRSASPAFQVHWLRLFSTLLHLLALACLWAMVRAWLPAGAAAGALAAAALLPMFAFIGASVSNDALANLAGAGLLWFWFAQRRQPSGAGQALRLGLAAGLALLAKATLAAPVFCMLLERLWVWRREQGARSAARRGALLVGAGAAVCGALLVRNLALYGDVWGLSRIGAYDQQAFGWSRLPLWLELFFQSFWGRFGWMTQPLPGWCYVLFLAVSLLSGLGLLADRSRMFRDEGRLLLAVFAAALAQNFWYGFLLTSQPQARYSFVALAAWAPLFCGGLGYWLERLPAYARGPVRAGLILAALAVDLLALRAASS
ncbi:MAG: DUF2142 domain-containing protein, partial [Elusimicrobiota bacterium]